MAIVPGAIPVRLIAVFGDAELPDGGVEIGTLSLPVTVTESTEVEVAGVLNIEVTPDVSVFHRLVDFLSDESHSDPEQRTLDSESDRRAVEQAQQARAAVYENPCASEPARFAADRRFYDAQQRLSMRHGGR